MDNVKKHNNLGEALSFLDLQGYFVKKYKDHSRPKVYDWEVFDVNDSAKSLGYYSDESIIDFANKIDTDIEIYSNSSTAVANIEAVPVKTLGDGGEVDDDSFAPMESATQGNVGSVEPDAGGAGQQGAAQSQGKPEGESGQEGAGKPSGQPSEGEGSGDGENGEPSEGKEKPAEGSGEGKDGEQSEGEGSDGNGDGEEDIVGKQCVIITGEVDQKWQIGVVLKELAIVDGEKMYDIKLSNGGEISLLRSKFGVIGDKVEYEDRNEYTQVGIIRKLFLRKLSETIIVNEAVIADEYGFVQEVDTEKIHRLIQEEGGQGGEDEEDIVFKNCIIISDIHKGESGVVLRDLTAGEGEKIYEIELDNTGGEIELLRSKFAILNDKVEYETEGGNLFVGIIKRMFVTDSTVMVDIVDSDGNVKTVKGWNIRRLIQEEGSQGGEGEQEEDLKGKECVIINERILKKGVIGEIQKYDNTSATITTTINNISHEYVVKREDFAIVGDLIEYDNIENIDSGKLIKIFNNGSASKNTVHVRSKINGNQILILARNIIRLIQEEGSQGGEGEQEEDLKGKECVIFSQAVSNRRERGYVAKITEVIAMSGGGKTYQLLIDDTNVAYIAREGFAVVGDKVEVETQIMTSQGLYSFTGVIKEIINNNAPKKNKVKVENINGKLVECFITDIIRLIQDEQESEEAKPTEPPVFQSIVFFKKLAGEEDKTYAKYAAQLYWFKEQPSWVLLLVNQSIGKGLVKLYTFLEAFDETANPNTYSVEYKNEIAALQDLDKKIFFNLYANFNIRKKQISDLRGTDADIRQNAESYNMLDKLNVINGTEIHISTRIKERKWIGVSIFKMDEGKYFVAVFDELYDVADEQGFENYLFSRTLRFVQALDIVTYPDATDSDYKKYIKFNKDETTSAHTVSHFKHFERTTFFNYLCNFTENIKSKDIKLEFEAHKDEISEYINGKFKTLYTNV